MVRCLEEEEMYCLERRGEGCRGGGYWCDWSCGLWLCICSLCWYSLVYLLMGDAKRGDSNTAASVVGLYIPLAPVVMYGDRYPNVESGSCAELDFVG